MIVRHLMSKAQGTNKLAKKMLPLFSGRRESVAAQSLQVTDDKKQTLASDKLVKASDLDTKGDEIQINGLKERLVLITDSVSTDGLYNVLVSGTSPLEEKIRAIVQEVYVQICSVPLKRLGEAELMLRQFLERRERRSDEGITVQYLTEHDAEKKAKIAIVRKRLNGINELQQRRNKAKSKREANGLAKNHVLKNVYKGHIPEEVTRSAKAIFWAAISLFSVGEGILINDSIGRMVNNDLDDPMIFMATVSIMVALVLSAHKLGQSLIIRNPISSSVGEEEGSGRGMSRYFSTILYGTAVALLFAGICYIRFSTVSSTDMDSAGFSELMGATGDSGGKDYLFVLINLGFLLIVIGLSKHMQRHENYYALDRAEIGYMNLETAYQKEEDDLRADVAKEEERIEDELMVEAQKHLAAHREHENSEIEQCKKIISGFRSHVKQVHTRLASTYENAIVDLRNNIVFARHREGLPAVSYNSVPIKPLDLQKDIDLSDIYDANGQGRVEPSKAEKTSQNGIHKGPIATTLSVLLLMVSYLVLPSCNNDQQSKPVGRTMAYIPDWSITQEEANLLPSTDAQTLFLFKEAGFAPARVASDRVTFLTTHIGTTSLAPMLRCDFPEAMPSMVKAQRRKQQTAFGVCVYEKIKTQNVQQGLKQSFIGAALSQMLPPLAASSDSVKVLLIVSDMVFNEKEVANFYGYGDRLMQNYDSVVRKIEAAYPALKDIDLSGLRCYVAYLPNDDTDKVAKISREFWTKWFTSKNGRIEFLPNLPEPNPTVSK